MRRTLAAAAFALAASAAAAQAKVPLVDAHVHLLAGRAGQADYMAALREAVAGMDELGVRTSVVLPPPQVGGMPALHDWRDFAAALDQFPGRFAFLGGGGTLNVLLHEAGAAPDEAKLARFERTAREILEAGAAGFGEIAAHHLSLSPGHPYEWVAPDHPFLLRLADIAAERDAVIDLHLDLVPEDLGVPPQLSRFANPGTLKENAKAFERLLAHNRKAKIVWAHAGSHPLPTLDPQRARAMLAAHPNLYMSLRIPLRMGPKPAGGGPERVPLVDPGGAPHPDWLAAIMEFPDRFVIGTDQFIANPRISGGGHGVEVSRFNAASRGNWRRFIDQLPAELARRIGTENAERLYRIGAAK